MQDKDFRGLFPLVLAYCAFCGFLLTATYFAEPGGLGFLFRMVACVGLIAGFLALFAADLIGIWTGHLPNRHNKH